MRFYFGTPGWGWTMWGFGYKAQWFIGFSMKRPVCPHGDCLDKTQCWEPCGELGHSEKHARVVPNGKVKADAL